MTALHKIYTGSTHRDLGLFRATWPPSRKIALGDVGTIVDGEFDPLRTLDDLDITAPSDQPEERIASGELDYTSSSGVSISLKGGAELNEKFQFLTTADAGALVEFSQEDGVVLHIDGAVIRRIRDRHALNLGILAALKHEDPLKRWQRDWVAIVEVVEAHSITLLVSEEAGARLELKASGTLAPTNLADINARLTFKNQDGRILKAKIAEPGTPLYKAVRVRKKLLGLLFDGVGHATGAPVTLPPDQELLEEANPDGDEFYESGDY